MSKNIWVYPSYYLIPDVLSLPKEVQYLLGKWNPQCFKMESIGYYYDKEKHELRMPRGLNQDSVLKIFPDRQLKFANVATHEKINIDLTNAPRDYVQEYVLSFMCGQGDYAITRNKSQLYVDLDTGGGKTFLMVATCCYFKKKMCITVPANHKLEVQWEEAIRNFTSLNRTEYLTVIGSDMCADIIQGKYKHIKIFIIPRSTILAFVRKYENRWDMVTKLFDAMEVDIKAVDEAHKDFDTCINIDCFTNCERTFYMSSSPFRSEHTEEKIYRLAFQTVLRYGKKILTKEQKHIIPYIVQFKSTPTEEQLKNIKTPYGTSAVKYEEYLLDPDGARDEFLDAYTYALYFLLRFRRRGGKILVMSISTEFAKKLRDYTNSVFPFLTTGLYIGSISENKDKDKELDRDIVFSTTKSFGEAAEFKNHQMTINPITYSSSVMADQIPGRIRKQEDRKGIYIEIVNINHPVAKKHYAEREKYLINKAKDGNVRTHLVDDRDMAEINDFFKKGYQIDDNGCITNNGLVVMHRCKRKK